ncbi:MAG TPA: lipocalin family protein [Prolixibacteraceae bacterium]|nr:lipocalin family protein [Prolixibacteraceae bacterium]
MNEKYMVGTWKMDTIFLKENTNLGDYKALYDQKFIELRDSTLFEFKADYSYIKTVKTKITTGVWKISDDGTQIIIIKEDSNNEEKSRILELNNNLLMMSPLSESTNSKVILKKVD